MIAIAALVVCIIGALVYAFATNPKVNLMGLISFAVGLFWFVYMLNGKSVRLF